jgi:hypothetical protein
MTTALTRPGPQPYNQLAPTAQEQFERALARRPHLVERLIERYAQQLRPALLRLLQRDIARVATEIAIAVWEEVRRAG